MKKMIVLAFLATIGLMATDYTSYTAEELAAMRGTIPAEDQEAFQSALQEKLSELTPEERKAIMSKAKAGTMTGKKMQKRQQTRTRTQSKAMDAVGMEATGGGHGAGGGGGHGGGNGGGGGGGNR